MHVTSCPQLPYPWATLAKKGMGMQLASRARLFPKPPQEACKKHVFQISKRCVRSLWASLLSVAGACSPSACCHQLQ